MSMVVTMSSKHQAALMVHLVLGEKRLWTRTCTKFIRISSMPEPKRRGDLDYREKLRSVEPDEEIRETSPLQEESTRYKNLKRRGNNLIISCLPFFLLHRPRPWLFYDPPSPLPSWQPQIDGAPSPAGVNK